MLFRTCSHVLGRWQILNLFLVLLSPDCLQWGDGLQPPGRGGWRSQNLRTISDGSLKDEASSSSQTTTLCMSLMLHWPQGIPRKRFLSFWKTQQEKARFSPAASYKAFLCTLEGLMIYTKVYRHPQ